MSGRAWWRVAPLVAALAWGVNHFIVLLLLYLQQEGYTQVAVDVLFATYIVGIIPGFLISGPLSDRFGRRPVLLTGAVLGIVGSVVLGLGAGSLPLLAVGRLVSCCILAVDIVVGSSWIKELSAPPYPPVPAPTAARRAALTLTAGFGAGPLVSGSIAQFGPAPTLLPYAVHILLVLLAVVPLLGAPETRGDREPLVRDLAPVAVSGRLLGVVAPAAPWVFGFPGVAFAVLPALVAARTGSLAIGYATLLAVVALASGAAVQPFAARIGAVTSGRQLAVGLAAGTLGVLLAALTGLLQQPAVGIGAVVLLGAGYGLCLVSGLTEVQRTAAPAALARLTAVYYSLTYVGFAFPVVLAALAALAPEPLLLVLLAAVVLACLAVSARNAGRTAR